MNSWLRCLWLANWAVVFTYGYLFWVFVERGRMSAAALVAIVVAANYLATQRKR